MTKAVTQIIHKHNELWGDNPSVRKINAGFTNTIFCVAEKYILKICHDTNNETEFCHEIDFYLENKGEPYILKLLGYSKDKSAVPYMYLIIEKLDNSLYDIWHAINEQERENIVAKICIVLKDFHKKQGETFDWCEYIKGYYEKHLAILETQNQLTAAEFALIRKAVEKFDLYFADNNFVFIHNDLHFDNIFYKDGAIKIIDFESSQLNPIDKELEIIYYMAEIPHKHANEQNEKLVEKEHFKNLLPYFKKHYPEMFAVPHLEKRIAIYHLRDALDQFATHKNDKELYERIIRLANLIVSGDIEIRKTQKTQTNIVFEMLKETALWIDKKNIKQWQCWIDPKQEHKDLVDKGIGNGEFYFAYLDNEVVGMYRLTDYDEWFWNDNGKDNAVYLHQFTTSRRHKGKGLGNLIIAEIEKRCKQQGAKYLRFDCYARNTELCDWYIKNGFIAKAIKTQPNGYPCQLFEKEIK
ncbi:MAG: GNAT family N-acetyltransferase [Bacteroidales bacterium]|jgi:thiamine kinase-like enzyme|nr:GNAT family N-acetyltransferase [Bacteroidales bacterium]